MQNICVKCQEPFVRTSNNQKGHPDCLKIVKKKYDQDYHQKARIGKVAKPICMICKRTIYSDTHSCSSYSEQLDRTKFPKYLKYMLENPHYFSMVAYTADCTPENITQYCNNLRKAGYL